MNLVLKAMGMFGNLLSEIVLTISGPHRCVSLLFLSQVCSNEATCICDFTWAGTDCSIRDPVRNPNPPKDEGPKGLYDSGFRSLQIIHLPSPTAAVIHFHSFGRRHTGIYPFATEMRHPVCTTLSEAY